MSVSNIGIMMLEGVRDTFYMTAVSTVFAYILGFPLAVLLYVSRKGGLHPMPAVHSAADIVVNILRSVPFLILLILVMPFTKLVVGKSYGSTATIVPLVIAAAPYVARMMESSFLEVDYGLIEAAQSMGASLMRIIMKVVLPEAKPSLLVGATITTGTILAYSAMAGAVGGGGLGDIAIRFGYLRYQFDILIITVILLIILVQIIQVVGMKIAKRTDKRAKN